MTKTQHRFSNSTKKTFKLTKNREAIASAYRVQAKKIMNK